MMENRNGTTETACPKCGGSGHADSGGVQSWGEPISIPCDCLTEQEEFLAWANEEYEVEEVYELNESNPAVMENKKGWMARAALPKRSKFRQHLDERDLQGAQGERDGWGPFPIVQVPWNVFDRAVMWVEDRRRYGDDGTIVDDWKALKTIQRAALAQPSGEVVVTKNESGAIVSVTRQDKEGRLLSVIAESQPSPAQAEKAEAERPIVSFEKYMQVMYDRDENAKRLDAALAEVERIKTISDNYYVLCVERQQQLDAALARVAELEKQEPVGWANFRDGRFGAYLHRTEDDARRFDSTALAGKPAGSKQLALYAAPVAQAQHSVPGEFSFEYRHPNGECHTVTVSREQVINEMPDFLFEALCSKFCNCEPVGETNVVECCCDEYAEEFKLIDAAPGKEVV
ncbi:hypothetical protein VL2_gp034 [Pseudomonas phage vB_PaeM_VL12]|nr:hypothetical protein VL2_gp034 [Pseudomonas phage vB_PaeM_VL12]